MWAHAHTRAYVCTHARTRVHTRIPVHAYTRVYMRMHVQTRTSTCAYICAHARAYMCAHTRACAHRATLLLRPQPKHTHRTRQTYHHLARCNNRCTAMHARTPNVHITSHSACFFRSALHPPQLPKPAAHFARYRHQTAQTCTALHQTRHLDDLTLD